MALQVKEAVETSALLRLPRSMPRAEKDQRVAVILKQFVSPLPQESIPLWKGNLGPAISPLVLSSWVHNQESTLQLGAQPEDFVYWSSLDLHGTTFTTLC
jgi:hypothetical protein